MASPASLKAGMYYGHPQNAFWRILRDITGDEYSGNSNDEKRCFLLRHGIALWDTLKSCEREGAADSAIKQCVPNDVKGLLEKSPQIRMIFLNGTASFKFYQKYHASAIPTPFALLPSTSPANARGGYAAKLSAWKVIAPFIR